jgi:IPT/TIG domain
MMHISHDDHRSTEDEIERATSNLRREFMSTLTFAMAALGAVIAANKNAVDPAHLAAIDAHLAAIDAKETTDEATMADTTAGLKALLDAANGTSQSNVPVVTGISPANGSVNGGETITITGNGFNGATGVNFGTVPATSVNVASDMQITVVSPAQPAATVDVTVITPAGTSATSSADQYTLA